MVIKILNKVITQGKMLDLLSHCLNLFLKRMGGDHSGEFCMWRIQGKVKFRLKFFNLRLILYFFCLLALIIHELGLGDEGNRDSI